MDDTVVAQEATVSAPQGDASQPVSEAVAELPAEKAPVPVPEGAVVPAGDHEPKAAEEPHEATMAVLKDWVRRELNLIATGHSEDERREVNP